MSEGKEVIQFIHISESGRLAGADVESWKVPSTGYCAFMRYIVMMESDEFGPYIEIRQIYVNSEERLKGYGTKFINFLVRLAKKKGIRKIYVATTAVDEDPFGKFLNKEGFERPWKVKDPEELKPQNLPRFPYVKRIRSCKTRNK